MVMMGVDAVGGRGQVVIFIMVAVVMRSRLAWWWHVIQIQTQPTKIQTRQTLATGVGFLRVAICQPAPHLYIPIPATRTGS